MCARVKGATVFAYYLIHQTGVHSLFDNAYLYPDCLYSNLDVRQSLKDFGYFCVIVPATFVLFRSRCVLLADIVAGELWEWRPSFSGTLVSTGKPDDTSYEACPGQPVDVVLWRVHKPSEMDLPRPTCLCVWVFLDSFCADSVL